MAWNDSGNGKDPWEKDGDQPNDLDKIVQGWQRKLSGVIGGGRASAGPGSSGSYVIMVLLLVAWLGTGLYRVDEAERGVVQRFGGYTKTTMPGLHWHYPFPIEVVDIVNVNAVDNFQYQTEMLTADRQYVFIQMVVQYRRTDPYNYSFKVVDPESTLQDVRHSTVTPTRKPRAVTSAWLGAASSELGGSLRSSSESSPPARARVSTSGAGPGRRAISPPSRRP